MPVTADEAKPIRTEHELTRVHSTGGTPCAHCNRVISNAVYSLTASDQIAFAEGKLVCADCVAFGLAVLAELEALAQAEPALNATPGQYADVLVEVRSARAILTRARAAIAQPEEEVASDE